MLYNSKTEYPFWLRDSITQTKILKAGMASMDFICELYRPTLNLVDELINEYADGGDDYTDTVYGYGPIEVVEKLIEKHGEIAT